MDTCPHCGEHLNRDAQSCPHCGSDFETGWNPDAEYYSVEIPEEESYPLDDEPIRAVTYPWQTIGYNVAVFVAAFIYLITVVVSCDTSQGVTLTLLLGLSYWLFVGFFRREV